MDPVSSRFPIAIRPPLIEEKGYQRLQSSLRTATRCKLSRSIPGAHRRPPASSVTVKSDIGIQALERNWTRFERVDMNAWALTVKNNADNPILAVRQILRNVAATKWGTKRYLQMNRLAEVRAIA